MLSLFYRSTRLRASAKRPTRTPAVRRGQQQPPTVSGASERSCSMGTLPPSAPIRRALSPASLKSHQDAPSRWSYGQTQSRSAWLIRPPHLLCQTCHIAPTHPALFKGGSVSVDECSHRAYDVANPWCGVSGKVARCQGGRHAVTAQLAPGESPISASGPDRRPTEAKTGKPMSSEKAARILSSLSVPACVAWQYVRDGLGHKCG